MPSEISRDLGKDEILWVTHKVFKTRNRLGAKRRARAKTLLVKATQGDLTQTEAETLWDIRQDAAL